WRVVEFLVGRRQGAREKRHDHLRVIDTEQEFYDFFDKGSEGGGGFAMTHFCGSTELEDRIKKDLAVTVRCVPTRGQGLPGQDEAGTCPFTGEPSATRVVWAKSY
ncbi:MAG: proline--tRNA ligase, partial [Planctomycetota bacterium]|nr:proline--tRNA ligase [Planctomycetota bacterium]